MQIAQETSMHLSLTETSTFQCTDSQRACLTPAPETAGNRNALHGISSDNTEYSRSASEFDDTEIHSFALKLICSNPNCGKVTIAIGRVEATPIYDGDQRAHHIEFLPKFFYPPVHVLPIPDCTPLAVKQTLVESFAVYFFDPSAAANKLRQAVELFLKKYAPAPPNPTQDPKLHTLIETFKLNNAALGELLMAVKWLGNDGSHANEKLTHADVENGYRVFFHVVTEHHQPAAQAAQASAKSIARGRVL
jgi:hypothetical protein